MAEANMINSSNRQKNKKTWGWRMDTGIVTMVIAVLVVVALASNHSYYFSFFLNNHKICSCSQVSTEYYFDIFPTYIIMLNRHKPPTRKLNLYIL